MNRLFITIHLPSKFTDAEARTFSNLLHECVIREAADMTFTIFVMVSFIFGRDVARMFFGRARGDS